MSISVTLRGAVVERGGGAVIKGVGLKIDSASWYGLIGANGSGKTSLLRAVGGRLPFVAGSCLLADTETASDREARARTVGFAPPADSLPADLRVRDLLDIAGGADAPALAPLRGPLGIDGLMRHEIGNCSAGMRQRVAIAAAFAGGRPLVILDEPFNWLDPVAAYDLRQALRAMVDGGLTLITALHDLTTLTAYCDGGAMLADGRVTLAMDGETLREASRDPLVFERRTIDLLRSGATDWTAGTEISPPLDRDRRPL